MVNLIENKFALGIIEKRRMYFDKNQNQIHKIVNIEQFHKKAQANEDASDHGGEELEWKDSMKGNVQHDLKIKTILNIEDDYSRESMLSKAFITDESHGLMVSLARILQQVKNHYHEKSVPSHVVSSPHSNDSQIVYTWLKKHKFKDQKAMEEYGK